MDDNDEIDAILCDCRERMRKAVAGRNRSMQSRFNTSDVLQEGIIQLLQKFNKEKKAPEITQSYLNRVASGHATKLRRQHTAKQRDVKAESDRPEAGASHDGDTLEVEQSHSVLVRCLGELDPMERDIVDRRVFQRMSFNAIAEQLQLSESGVRRKYQSSLKKLKQLFCRHMGIDE